MTGRSELDGVYAVLNDYGISVFGAAGESLSLIERIRRRGNRVPSPDTIRTVVAAEARQVLYTADGDTDLVPLAASIAERVVARLFR